MQHMRDDIALAEHGQVDALGSRCLEVLQGKVDIDAVGDSGLVDGLAQLPDLPEVALTAELRIELSPCIQLHVDHVRQVLGRLEVREVAHLDGAQVAVSSVALQGLGLQNRSSRFLLLLDARCDALGARRVDLATTFDVHLALHFVTFNVCVFPKAAASVGANVEGQKNGITFEIKRVAIFKGARCRCPIRSSLRC